MKSFLLSSFLIAFLVSTSLQDTYSQTIIPGGYVSGTWTAAGSPYLIQGNITIHTDSTLNIQPGVQVNFQGNHSFTVNGFLQAIGTAVDSIHFIAVTTWMGLRFANAPDSSHLAYCTIRGSTSWGGIICSNSNPVITHSTISDNRQGVVSGGISLQNSNANIAHCTISNNENYGEGGGIRISGGSPQISYCSIIGNYGVQGGGIWCAAGTPLISNTSITRNLGGTGGGIYVGGGQVTITDCIITADTANGMGGGIYVSSTGGSLIINNSTINNCKAPSGGGIYVASANSVLITGCTFESNVVNNAGGGGAMYINQASTVSIISTTLDDNYCGSYPGGVINSVNCSNLVIDHCDVVNNSAAVIEGGIILNGNTTMTLKNSIFRNQQGAHIWFQSYTSASVSYNDFYGTPLFYYPPTGLGVLTQTNANGDSCDVFYNIYLDPLFVDFPNGDYNLSWANWPKSDSTKSPCIDAGDPSSPHDPDNTITDMGAFYFHQPGTIIPGGYVSGIWTAANSPYMIHGDITIHTDSTLTIEPGVEVIFDGYYRLNVAGHLYANGTASDSIYFMPTDTLVGWRGIYYSSLNTQQQLSYCVIKYGFESGIWIQAVNLNLKVSYCTIAHCRSEFGGGINAHGYGSTLQISHSTIAYNIAESVSGGKGGGIYLFYGTLIMDTCTVHANRAVIPIEDEYHAVQGGGIYMGPDAGNATITAIISGSFITDNFIGLSNGGEAIGTYPPDRGGGIYIGSIAPVTISHCNISGNRANIDFRSGGGIFSDIPCILTTLSYCNISNNWTPAYAGGYEATGSSNIINCTFSGNYYFAILFHLAYPSTVWSVSNTIVAYNEFGMYKDGNGTLTVNYSDNIDDYYGLPPGFGVPDTVNFNGDPCDVFFNISMDPLFADTANGDYRLTWANWPTPDSTKSPCIDAGDPLSPLDPDGTFADQGVFSFDQSVPVELVSFSGKLVEYNVILEWVTATEINNLGFEIHRQLDGADWEKIGFVEGHGTTTEFNSYSFTDKNILTGIYLYQLKQIDYDGSFEYSVEVKVEVGAPLEFSLEQNYPNPFNPSTKISYQLPFGGDVTLKIYDILGNEIETIVDEYNPAGSYEVDFNTVELSSGIYFYTLRTGNFIESRKMVLLK